MFASKEFVMDLVNKAFHKTIIDQQENDYKGNTFKFGIDDNGNYGYIKDGEDTVTPFVSVYNLGSITLKDYKATYTIDVTKVPNYSNLTADNFILQFTKAHTTTGSNNYNNAPIITYDATTGIVTITGYAMTGSTYLIVNLICIIGTINSL